MIRTISRFVILVFSLIFSVFLEAQPSANLDEQIRKTTDRLLQYPGRIKFLPELKMYFEEAQKLDLERAHQLQVSGQPDVWYEIHRAYSRMDERQKTVGRLPEKTIARAGISFIDMKDKLAESKNRAVAYHYAHAEKLLASGEPVNASLAYKDLLIVAGLNGTYRDLDRLMRRAILTGATKMVFELHNYTGKVISPALTDELARIVWEYKKTRYGQEKKQENGDFPFSIRVVLTEMDVSPDKIREVSYGEERDLYQENVVVDTLRCLITEYRQLKKARLSGSLDYVDLASGQVVLRVPVSVESIFSNAYATLQGDPRAAGESTKLLLSSKKADYPSAGQMILDAGEEFARKAGEIILAQ